MIVRYGCENGVAYITLDRPQALNALNGEMAQELEAAWRTFEEDQGAGVAILTGNGRAFCSGVDMREVARSMQSGHERRSVGFGLEIQGPQVTKPKLCAVNGAAVGSGVGLVLGCDIAICVPEAIFSMPFAARGTVGGTLLVQLARKTSLGLAMLMGITAQRIDAQVALRMGLVQEIVPPDQLLPRATEIAQRILENSPLAVRAIKERLLKSMDLSYREALESVGPLEAEAAKSAHAREGTIAYAEKRKARF
ncbi:MAG: enoyl-CoA hydratase/isomerase family protein [Chloroflexi bacterium]|nr:enoyl-CoA hydratase/isomerase family protein [Chloroflexota bacterium]